MSSINKLKNTWISNDTTNLQGTYNKVSILNEGKTELKGDTLINTKLAINKNIDSVNDYKLDVNGNINFSGSLYQNNALFTSGITQAFADGRYSQLAGANSFTGSSNTFSNDLIQTDKNILQKGLLFGSNFYSYNFGDPQVILLQLGVGPVTFNLPSVTSSANLGTIIYVIKINASQLTINASSGFTFSDETNADVSTKTYVAQSRVFVFVAMKTTGSQWKLINCMNLNTNLNFDWNGTHTFNGNLPTSTLTPTTGTQLITKNFTDSTYQTIAGMSSYLTSATASSTYLTSATASSTYGQLGVANTWSQQNTFSTGILPRRLGGDGTDIQLGGNNQLQYRQTTSANNISIGVTTLQGDSDATGRLNNTGSRNIGIGHQVLTRLDSGSDMIFIGHQAGQNCGSTRLHSVQPQRCIAIGTNSQKGNLYATDAISVGYNSLVNASGPAIGNICIGSNTGNGLNYQSNNVIIGSGAGPTVNDNSVTCIGYQCLGGATGQFNSGTALGVQAGYNNANGQGGTFIGTEAGFSNTTGNYNTCLGLKAGRPSGGTLNNTICLGYNSGAQISQECVFGGEASTEQVFLTLPNKHRLSCNQTATGPSFNITFRTNENIIIDNTITSINLPTPDATGINQGAKFNLLKITSASNITINAPASQTIGFMNNNGSYTTASSYTMANNTNNLSLVCIANSGTSWLVINNIFVDLSNSQTISAVKTFSANPVFNSNAIQDSYLSTNVNNTITSSNTFMTTYNQYISFVSNITGDVMNLINCNPKLTSGYSLDINGANIKANGTTISDTKVSFLNQVDASNKIPSTAITNTTFVDLSNSQTIAGVKTFSSPPVMSGASITSNTIPYASISYTSYIPNAVTTLTTTATSLSSPLYNYYTFTSATADTNITLPTITADIIGCPLTFRRVGNTSFQLIIKTASGSNTTIIQRASITETAQFTNYTLLSTTQYVGTVMAISTTKWSVIA